METLYDFGLRIDRLMRRLLGNLALRTMFVDIERLARKILKYSGALSAKDGQPRCSNSVLSWSLIITHVWILKFSEKYSQLVFSRDRGNSESEVVNFTYNARES